MKRIYLLLSLSLLSLGAFAQIYTYREIRGSVAPMPSKSDPEFIDNIYLYPDYVKGVVTMADNKKLQNVDLIYDLHTDKLIYKGEDNLAYWFKDPVREFTLPNLKSGEKPRTFRNGYPEADHNTKESYYEVLSDGRITLLKKTSKVVTESIPYGSSTPFKSTEDVFSYYIYKNGTITKVKKDKKALAQILDNDRFTLSKYMNDTKLTLKSDSDFAAVVDYYNKL